MCVACSRCQQLPRASPSYSHASSVPRAPPREALFRPAGRCDVAPRAAPGKAAGPGGPWTGACAADTVTGAGEPGAGVSM
ncbi:hypothetical protein Y1Q_0006504 [Alligator mississippiensis]|uniref:Uncharacterized protein n=1 Tax=Alligator mississippiensis TaxID=8496 RepID=A0A151PIY0_ALLMI|nr:hypothetical protein Y1Q_0006504 [Alligator mississippiensis]